MRTKNILPILFILIITIATASAGTESTNDDSLILLKTGYIDTDNAISEIAVFIERGIRNEN